MLSPASLSFLPLFSLFLFLPLTLARPPIPYDKSGYTRLRLPRELTLSIFTGAIGGIRVPAITSSGNPRLPFLVASAPLATFFEAAHVSCAVQHGQCARAVASGALGFGLGDCGEQNFLCIQIQSAAPSKCFYGVNGCTATPPLVEEPLSTADVLHVQLGGLDEDA